jgi:hypothetical protein
VNGQWLECWSEYRHIFRGRSEKEIMLATHELRKRSQNHAQHSFVTAKRLAELLASAEAQESLLAQRLKDLEVRKERSSAGVLATENARTAPPPQEDGGRHHDCDRHETPVERRIYREF